MADPSKEPSRTLVMDSRACARSPLLKFKSSKRKTTKRCVGEAGCVAIGVRLTAGGNSVELVAVSEACFTTWNAVITCGLPSSST